MYSIQQITTSVYTRRCNKGGEFVSRVSPANFLKNEKESLTFVI